MLARLKLWVATLLQGLAERLSDSASVRTASRDPVGTPTGRPAGGDTDEHRTVTTEPAGGPPRHWVELVQRRAPQWLASLAEVPAGPAWPSPPPAPGIPSMPSPVAPPPEGPKERTRGRSTVGAAQAQRAVAQPSVPPGARAPVVPPARPIPPAAESPPSSGSTTPPPSPLAGANPHAEPVPSGPSRACGRHRSRPPPIASWPSTPAGPSDPVSKARDAPGYRPRDPETGRTQPVGADACDSRVPRSARPPAGGSRPTRGAAAADRRPHDQVMGSPTESGRQRDDRVTPPCAAHAAETPKASSQGSAMVSPPPSSGTIATVTAAVTASCGTAGQDRRLGASRPPASQRDRAPNERSARARHPLAEPKAADRSPHPNRPIRGESVPEVSDPLGAQPLSTRPNEFARVRPEADPEPSRSGPARVNRWPRLPDEREEHCDRWADRWPALPIDEPRERPEARSPWGSAERLAESGRHRACLDREQRGERWNA